MALQRITQPTAALVRAATAYDWIVQMWGLPSTPIAALALDRVAHRIRPSAEPLAGSAVCARFVRGFRWAADDDGDDTWRLCGLSGSGDAVDGGVVDGRSWLVATWQHRDARRTRVSFVDVTDSTAIRYTHVLLGEPAFDHRGATFRDVACEACGVAWYGDRLYVCEPLGGLRVFALDQIKAVPRGDRSMIGRQADGSYRAHGERCVAPQIATYEPLPGFRHGWSFCSIDRSVSPHALVTGEYDDGPSPLY
ncbi:MAG TPA: hypothetical protein VFQ53_26395 [Kofleriaceae bacterium]|nr:hypothetical protein [Kofleriaceae bacterium]